MHPSTREIRLAEALVGTADTLADGFEAGPYLSAVADHCVRLLPAQAAGFMLIDGGRTVSLAASSAHQAVARDLLEAQRDGGPCLDSYGSGRPVPPVSIRAARAAARWPGFTERALVHDIAATFAVPLLRDQRPLGALNVFVRALPDGSRSDDGTTLRLAQLIADCAALGLENHTAYVQCRTLAGQLQQALSSRVRIEQAKGMLAERWNTDADHAFVALRQYARRRRVPLDQVAGEVVDRVADDAELRREAERAQDEGRA
ncbi:GAF and ANTAR domain-containing protein [Streptomyces caeruleatus]|uniref:Response regulator receiver protein n=1 Tax=Streptomyces caeruleatus TaxID=661399 RepID=A0A101U121_9ACTN|nr:GAF and ANTAR domain-containing protein [Streptomyces caeruleatus]KUO01983.1 response regulator receiver protein [Streptomyces caeruleatus]